ncbi:MAG TPA: molybdenum cofactor biosynthesis protein, partial [Marinobacter sp.]|nr:molybdenum cofactor biosynthesis protein [Marinobacter sp.]
MSHANTGEPAALNMALLTVSDSRGAGQDTSGQYLEDSLVAAGHRLTTRRLLPDDVYLIRALIARWIAEPDIHCVIITGGTGFHERDSTPEAVRPLLDKVIEGFGEEFRRLSVADIGSS